MLGGWCQWLLIRAAKREVGGEVCGLWYVANDHRRYILVAVPLCFGIVLDGEDQSLAGSPIPCGLCSGIGGVGLDQA